MTRCRASPARPRAVTSPRDGGSRVSLSEAGRLIFVGRALRSFAFGWLSVILALYLDQRGFGAAAIGAVFTATMVEDAVLTMLLSTMAARVGPARVMAATAPLIALGGLLLALPESRALVLLGAVLGTLSPNGQEAGPFAPMEQALLPRTVRSGSTVRVFGWYNVFAFLPAAAGAGAAGATLGWALRRGVDEAQAQRGDAPRLRGRRRLAHPSLRAPRAARAGARPRGRRASPGRLGLAAPAARCSSSPACRRWTPSPGASSCRACSPTGSTSASAPGPEALGALFFGTSLLSALSFLVATRVAERVGLLNTMVFTHLPSNVLLLAVPFMPSFATAAAVLLARHVLSQMDVPTRQAYTMALVAPEERPAAAGLTASARALAQACAPVVSGLTMAAAATPLPFLLAGGLKIVYDLSLFFRFRSVPLDDPSGGGRAW